MLSQAADLTSGMLKAQSEDGRPARLHFGEKGHQSTKPDHRVVAQTGDTTSVEAFVPTQFFDSYVEHLAKKYGGTPTVVSRTLVPPTWHTLNLSVPISDLRRLNAKIALNTGALHWGDAFLKSPLADWLRVVLDVWSDWPPSDRPGALTDPDAGANWQMTVRERDAVLVAYERALNRILAAHFDEHSPTHEPAGLLTVFQSGSNPLHTSIYSVVLDTQLPLLVAPHELPASCPAPAVFLHPTTGVES